MRRLLLLVVLLFGGCADPAGVSRLLPTGPSLHYDRPSIPSYYESAAGFSVRGCGGHCLGVAIDAIDRQEVGTFYFHDGTTSTESSVFRFYPGAGFYPVIRVVGTDTARYTVHCTNNACK